MYQNCVTVTAEFLFLKYRKFKPLDINSYWLINKILLSNVLNNKKSVREIMTDPNHNILFMQLIIQNQQIAMMAMGKIKNPVTDKIERNLEHAKIYIDTLDMLLTKTKGNLSEYEEKFLTETLKDLQLNYVDEMDKNKNKTDKEKEKTAEEK